MYKWLLWGKRTLIAVIILAGYGFYWCWSNTRAWCSSVSSPLSPWLSSLPGVFALLFWSRATRAGFIAGLWRRALVWAVTLLARCYTDSGLVAWELGHASHAGLGQRPWSLRPFARWVQHLLFAVVSLLTAPSDEEREAADACRMTPISLPWVSWSAPPHRASSKDSSRVSSARGSARHEVGQALSRPGNG